MSKFAKILKSFWGEAVNTVIYLVNGSPLVPLDFDIPQRVWTGKDVSYAHLKVFGCKAFMHVPNEQRSKLDDKSTLCIFIGYGDEEFSYMLWDSEKKKIDKRKDVVLHEHETIEDMEKNVSGAKLTYEGVADLTHEQTSFEVPLMKQRCLNQNRRWNSKNQSSRRKRVVMIMIREVLIKGSISLHLKKDLN